MSKSKLLTLRIQSPEGTKRIDVHPTDSILELFEKVHEAFGLTGYGFALYRKRGCKDELISSRIKTVRSYGLSHGDMLYLAPLNGAMLWSQDPSPRPSTSSGVSHSNNTASGEPVDSTELALVQTQSGLRQSFTLQEDEVDLQLWKLDGKVQRKRDEKLCRHGSNGCCVHCSPLEPFDETYLKEQNIKHLSFHSYLRKLTAGVDRGKFVSLEDISCRIKTGCKDHPPWPKGICSKCQPNAITLNRQVYRHVDNVMFENAHLVERFLNYWRSTGHQRIGFLYGRYEIHADVPLGIRATVAAIYEPPQESTRDSIVLLPDEKELVVQEMAQQLGLHQVGWIFTDLVADDIKKGTVKHVRNIESHFLSAEECIMAGHFQNKQPNPCRFSPVGYFGSKFVTVCVTGDATNQVHMEGYGVSNQCMALVRDNCLVPTKDAPELGYVKESTDKQFVPDVYYKEKDGYGNEVPRLARPLPVEYLLVDIPVSTPLNPLFTFCADANVRPFPVENRMVDGHIQDFSALSSYMQQFTPDCFLKAVSDFHFLLYISSMDMLPMKDYMGPVLEAVRTRNSEQARDWSRSEHWATVEQLISASLSSPPQSRPHSVAFAGMGAVGGGVELGTDSSENGLVRGNDQVTSQAGPGPLWTCPHCTYLNSPELVSCEMCSLPR
ncbi:nuclear protein localization protein 4 homolog [Zootermopsis nevadensis]|nr:nuclear protein localization protein 4 homolog [Zootermopsis nevadensis]XP_021925199.1 nuclear protein localization protein 4 homolog [Zootermopsis nevadensis]XP_021925201.1 nuclear protein localization protein 4 homolog [Zootermopsis nevadensis]XP_021925202.1 nuclear protein localization protein 4 homolog [Zootermopsis nevadensis]